MNARLNVPGREQAKWLVRCSGKLFLLGNIYVKKANDPRKRSQSVTSCKEFFNGLKLEGALFDRLVAKIRKDDKRKSPRAVGGRKG